MSVRFDPQDVKFTFAGMEVKGFADGTFIEVAADEPWIETPRAPLARSGTVTLTLTHVGGDTFDELLERIDAAASAQGVHVQHWNLVRVVRRAIRRWRRKQRMALRRRRGRGACSA